MSGGAMMEAGLAGVAVWGPGLAGWEASLPVLRGETPYLWADMPPPPPPAILPANERRRSSAVVRLALHVAEGAVAMSGLPCGGMRSVFASSSGDGAVVHSILEALAAGGDISPTAFHNSVHNAAAGYWSIGHGSNAAATAIGCHDSTLAAALLKGAAELNVEGGPLLLCVYDAPLPAPLAASRPFGGAFGVALVLVNGPGPLGRLGVRYRAERTALPCAPETPGLRAVMDANPSAQCLRLLEAIARGAPDACALPYLDGWLEIAISPPAPADADADADSDSAEGGDVDADCAC